MTNHYGRTYRDIMPEDIQSAQRGLNMWNKPISWLRNEREAHSKIDAFASAVIVAAIDEILAERALG